jgi:hypothetical protein
MPKRRTIEARHVNKAGIPVHDIGTTPIPAEYWGGPAGWIKTTFNRKSVRY